MSLAFSRAAGLGAPTAREEAVSLKGVDFSQVGGLSAELLDKLDAVRPASFGAAAWIQGMTPAALAALAAHLRKREAAAA